MKTTSPKKNNKMALSNSPLHYLTGAALLLPGLLQTGIIHAEEADSVDFQYSHYEEGKREGTNQFSANQVTGVISIYPVPNNRSPITVDSLHGSARVSLTDRVKFAFNYIEDTWSGATPFGSAPERSGAYFAQPSSINKDGTPIFTGASPFAKTKGAAFFDSKGNVLYGEPDPLTGIITYRKDKTVHVMGYASPETRKQGDFKLSYDWDDAAIDLGGGLSLERDYESRFANLAGRMDFNQKQTTANLNLSYTNSDINATPEILASTWFNWDAYQDQITEDPTNTRKTIHGNRQDWAAQLGLTQILNQDSVLSLGMGYTRSTGFLENPYKVSWIFGIDPTAQPQADGIISAGGQAFIEQRPDARNLWNWTLNWAQYIEPLDAALHFNYQFAHDDWGINAHTFAADWVQPIGYGWTLTPRMRYYSQESANFYQPFFKTRLITVTENGSVIGNIFDLPKNFSSDQRLSGYGTLSGGVTLSKQFAKGIGVEAGFEYYTHQGGLKLGGGGEQAFADYDYWVANAALKVNLSSLGQGLASGISKDLTRHNNHNNIPAGVMFAHTLPKAGDMMLGYRYKHSQEAKPFLHGDHSVSEAQISANGCPGSFRSDPVDGSSHFDGPCAVLPREMNMSMHMLELMYAPTDWLTLMLMPQFMDMRMDLYQTPEQISSGFHAAGDHLHETGGIGDTGMYAFVNLFDRPNHHLHASLGVTAPTGDVGIKLKDGTKNLDTGFIHYGMQLGSGTWDFKPSLTYLGKAGDWNWGAQLVGTKRLESKNESGFAFGDMFETSAWVGYDLTHWLSFTVRAAYTWQGSIKGRYPRSTRFDSQFEGQCDKANFTFPNDPDGDGIPNGPDIFDQASYNACLVSIEDGKRQNDANDRPTSMDFPKNYGGQYVDLGLGISATVPSGALEGNRLAFEWLQPIYTNVNGYQLDRDGALSFTWSYGF